MSKRKGPTTQRYKKRYKTGHAYGPGAMIRYGGQRGAAARRARYRNPRTGGYLGIESKFLDCAWDVVAIASSGDGSGGELQPSSGCTNAISIPAQGDGEAQRDGRQYCITSVYVSGVVNTSAAAGSTEALGYYFALVLDTQANGATIVSENVYLNPSTNSNAMLPQPLRNLQYSKRFRILDRQYVAPGGLYSLGTGATANIQDAPTVTLSWRGKILCDTSGTGADVAVATDNAIHVIAYTGSTTYTPTFIGKSRVRFVG